MRRVRRAGPAALVLVLLATLGSPESRPVLAGPVPWSTATLVLSELQTGGASASDEFVEVANQGAGPVDLLGLELVYATSSGSTVTRKASWPASAILAAGQRTLIANGAGLVAGAADQVYSGGFAATGGALALRIIGGEVIDAVGWGDATNAFVEGVAAPAPTAGASLERLPGGPDGNGEDTNDNATDWFLQSSPGPQGLSAPLVPAPGGPVPTPSATPNPTPTVSPTASPSAAPTPSASATATPTPAPSPSASPTPTASPTASPTPSPSPSPTVTPVPTPSPTPDTTQSIAAARAAADGSIVNVVATLTTDLGALESGHTAFVQDATAGIAIYLTTPGTDTIPAGTRVRVRGEVSSRYAQRTIRVDEPAALVTLDTPGLPAAHGVATGLADEASEGLRIATSGTLLAGRDELADGTAVSIDDGSGPVRLVIAPGALAGGDLTTGSQIAASGPLGQRDSTGSGTTGYRLYVTRPADLVVMPPPTPSPTLPPTPSPSPSVAPSPTPSANPTGTATPAPTSAPTSTSPPSVDTIAEARQETVGATVTVRGTVTAEPGRLGTPPLIAIQDGTGGIVVRLPDDAARPARGDVVVVTGALADPYGQLEVRPRGVTGVLRVDHVTGPAATQVTTLGESTEGRLVTIVGTIATKPAKASSGDLTFDLDVAGGRRLRLAADASSRIATTSVTTGWTVRVTGIGGQRASRKGALDGYRVWLRDPADIVRTTGPTAAPTTSPSPTSGPTGAPKPTASGGSSTPVRSIAAAIRTTDDVRIRAVVTAGRTLLDSSGRRIVVQDASGAVEVLLPADIAAPGPGARVEVAGRIGTAYGAPRLRATDLERLGTDAVPAPLEVRGALTKAHTWRLVRIHGRIEDTRKLGDRVRAEIAVGAQRIVVVGQPSVGLASDDLPEGATATVTGIVRAAYPNATDQRPSLLPRSTSDVRVQGRGASQGASDGAAGAAGGGSTAARADGGASIGDGEPGDSMAAAGVPDADLVALAAVEGQTVRVGGLVVDLTTDGFTLDDGTAIGVVVLAGSAVELAPLIEPTDAINVIGRVERRPVDEPDGDDGFVVVVDDPAGVTLGADLGSGASTDPAPSSPPSPIADPATVRVAGLGDPLAGLPGAGAGLASLLFVAVASVVVTWLRRRHARTLLDHRVAVRLANLGRSGAPDAVVRGPDGAVAPGSPAGPNVA